VPNETELVELGEHLSRRLRELTDDVFAPTDIRAAAMRRHSEAARRRATVGVFGGAAVLTAGVVVALSTSSIPRRAPEASVATELTGYSVTLPEGYRLTASMASHIASLDASVGSRGRIVVTLRSSAYQPGPGAMTVKVAGREGRLVTLGPNHYRLTFPVPSIQGRRTLDFESAGASLSDLLATAASIVAE
jgi:hypothetical protein